METGLEREQPTSNYINYWSWLASKAMVVSLPSFPVLSGEVLGRRLWDVAIQGHVLR